MREEPAVVGFVCLPIEPMNGRIVKFFAHLAPNMFEHVFALGRVIDSVFRIVLDFVLLVIGDFNLFQFSFGSEVKIFTLLVYLQISSIAVEF